MLVKQISVFIENKKGRVAEVTGALSQNGIDILAISIADTTNFGILRMIVSDPDKAVMAIKGAGCTANITDVVAIRVPDKPGGLNEVLLKMAECDISIEYLYSYARRSDNTAIIILRVEQPEAMVSKLGTMGIETLRHEEVYQF